VESPRRFYLVGRLRHQNGRGWDNRKGSVGGLNTPPKGFRNAGKPFYPSSFGRPGGGKKDGFKGGQPSPSAGPERRNSERTYRKGGRAC